MLVITLEPQFYDHQSNDFPNLMINILCPGKSYAKLYGAESQFNNVRFNDIPTKSMKILWPKHKVFSVTRLYLKLDTEKE